ncbi:hypothetical protein HanRHA438_Chr01g0012841 [Helianthus annuus]|nr:hypothetical protein HanRHA438_Chr01g0012841 [Helianthus annuus]
MVKDPGLSPDMDKKARATINGPVVKLMRAICQQLINPIASPLKNVAM